VKIGSAGVAHAVVAASLQRQPAPRTARAFEVARPAKAAHVADGPRAAASTRTAPGTARHVATDFEARVAAIAVRHRMAPRDLLAVMRFESGLRPDAVNPTTHAVGLIQFLPGTAADLLGLPHEPGREARAVEAFGAMSADEQLDFVDAYLDRVLGGHGAESLRDAYMAVLYPAAVGQGAGFVLGRADGASAFDRAVYRQNAGLDVDRDGVLTAGEAAARVARVRG